MAEDRWELGGPGGQVVDVELNMRARRRAGEPAAFGELFDQHAWAVYHHGYRLTGDRAVAEDVLSTTFLQAWRMRRRIDPDGGSLRPWLLGVATNIVRNHSRKARRERELLARLAPRDRVPDFADDVAARLDDAGTLASVRDALRTLRTAERDRRAGHRRPGGAGADQLSQRTGRAHRPRPVRTHAHEAR
jgi:RNA polymerase sigma-70 factor (ECF subfamily)